MSETRNRIISATNELFRVHGYHGTSLSEISKAAAATIGSIYHFFPGGKESLTVAVIKSTGAIYRELFEMIAAEAADPTAAFVDFFEGAAAVLTESDFLDPCPIGTIAREVASTNDVIRLAAREAFESWIDAAAHQLTSAGVRSEVAHDLAILFVATLEGSFIISRTQRSVEPMLAAGRRMAPLIDAAVEDGLRSRSD
ncbi:MAG: TetR/AcrR family transcriptional regulator [Acidimicrobiia bacterium]|nr:TetR/AcrR family transcriptional regulator [Acidimicrobiia bacterium]